MSKQNIKALFVTHQFPTSGGRRPETVVKYLPRFGVTPVVLTSSLLDQSSEEILKHEKFSEIKTYREWVLPKDPFKLFYKIFRMPKLADFLSRFFLFPDIWASWIPQAVYRGLKIIRQNGVDVILTTSPPESAHLVGYILHRITGLPWVSDFQDLWTQKEINFRPATALHRLIAKKLEKAIFNRSSYLLANTKLNAELYLKEKLIAPEQLDVLRCGFDPADSQTGESAIQSENKLVFGYLGYFDKPGFPYPEMLEIFSELSEEGLAIEIQVIGYVSNEAMRFTNRNGHAGLLNYTPELPNFRAIPRLQQISDVLLVMLYETPYSPAIVPLKLYNYLPLGKKILAIAPETGEVQNIVSETNLGKAFSIGKKPEIKQFVRELYREKIQKHAIDVKPNFNAIQKYNVVSIVQKLSEILKKAVDEKQKN